MGHIAAKCPSKPALFTEVFTEVDEIMYMNGDVEASQTVDPRITRSGTIEGKTVEDIVLETGCAQTMVRRDLIRQKTEVGRVRIRCAHGDTREYPLSSVEIGFGEAKFQVEAAVSSSLPEPVLLGWDVPGLIDMLQSDQKEDLTLQTEAVVTRSQARRLEEDGLEQERKQQEVRAKPNPMEFETATDTSDQEIVTDTLVNQEMEKPVGAEMDPDLFINVKERPQLSRREKRQQRHQMAQVNQTHPLDLSTCELRKMQQEDATLEDIRAKVRNPTKMTRRVFYEENGLLYRQWTPPQGDEDTTIQQVTCSSHSDGRPHGSTDSRMNSIGRQCLKM